MKTSPQIKADWGVLVQTPASGYLLCVKTSPTRCIPIEDLATISGMQSKKRWSIKNWATTVPLHACIVKPVSLPTDNLNEALQMLEFELPSIIPLSAREMVYGCSRVHRPDDGMIHLLVYILRRTILTELLKPLQDAGIACRYVLLDALAAYHGVTLVPSVSEPDVTTLLGIHQGVVVVSQNQSVCAIESLQCDMLESLPHQINAIIDAQTEASHLRSDPAHLIGSLDQDTNHYIKSHLGHGAQVSALVFEKGSTGAAWQTDPTSHPSCAFDEIKAAGLLDAVTHESWAHANLLPKDDIDVFDRLSQRRKLMVLGGLILLVVAQMHGLLYGLNARISKQCDSIEKQISPISTVAKDVDSKRQQLIAIAGQYGHRGIIRKVYNELCEFTPNTITLSSLTIESLGQKGTSISLQGQANSSLEAMEYLTNASNLNVLSPDQTGRINAMGKSNLFEFQSQGIITEFKQTQRPKELKQ